MIRAKYLREEASWRQLPSVSSSGHHVLRLQVVFQEQRLTDEIQSLYGGHVGLRINAEEGGLHFHNPQGLRVGLSYDMIVSFKSMRLPDG
jgi:hypothetical protein